MSDHIVENTINEFGPDGKWGDLMRKLAGNGHTNGCECLECRAEEWYKEHPEHKQ